MDKVTLDKQQSACVLSDKHHIIVVAAAGSGKTRVLTERFKHLLETGVPACNLVAITFTNLAAEEMRERLMDVPNSSEAFIGTIHSFANRIMKDSGQVYQIYNKDLDLQYHQYLIVKYCKYLKMDRYVEYRELRDKYDVGKVSEETLTSFLTDLEYMELQVINRSPERVQEVCQAYAANPVGTPPPSESIQVLCKRYNVLTFDELLEEADKYFRSINASIDHLLVDEFQDVGHLEFRFFEALKAQNTFYVGDDYQSIYGFKGGDVELFKKLIRSPEYTTYYLTNNYRNEKAVLDLAATVIEQVPDRIRKDITAVQKGKGSVVIYRKNNLRDILVDIDPSQYGQYFILTRSNKELFHIINDYFEPMGIPYVTFKREGLKLSDLRALLGSDKLKIMTVHTSKGLESDRVILYGDFPVHKPSYIRNTDERKVMYVGITRARKMLYVLN